MAKIVLTEAQNQQEIHLHAQDELILQLTVSPGTGYAWVVDSDLDDFLSPTGDMRFEKMVEPTLGGTELQIYTFLMLSAGIYELRLSYRRPWEKPAQAQDRVSFRLVAG